MRVEKNSIIVYLSINIWLAKNKNKIIGNQYVTNYIIKYIN
jgi:hypothetical protein